MKEKLTLETIVPYCIYGLTGYFFDKYDIVTSIDFEYKIISSLNNGNALINDFKPLLHPLSKLTIKKLSEYYPQLTDDDLIKKLNHIIEYPLIQPYLLVQWLIKNLFDVFDLLGKNLAIEK